jgi:hypothetical protein
MPRQQHRVTQGFAGADIRSLGARQREALPAGSADSGNGLLRCAVRACLKKALLFQMQTQ